MKLRQEYFNSGFRIFFLVFTTLIFEKITYDYKNILKNENVYNLIAIKFILIFPYNLLALDSMYMLFYVIG